ncbi:hypothetical protein K474DRAFT_1596895 [Panus rudis PR-1116 ss-1]|nr:hypothetical protein K474DRAFT_1596895 [Panus rudis PR-1116 ss-1]
MSNISLETYRVRNSDEAYYIPDFVSKDEEQYLIRKICESPQPKWKKLHNRRLQIWGGELTAKNQLIPQPFPDFIVKFPDVLGRIQATGSFHSSPHGRPNHVILNEYLSGQGIMPHEDGPSYHPVVATLSLGSHAVFHYYQYRSEEDATDDVSGNGRSIDSTPVVSLLLEPRSLVITRGFLYRDHLHGINDVMEDVFPGVGGLRDGIEIANVDLLADEAYREMVIQGGTSKRDTRYSLTCRDVERVAKHVPLATR